MGPIQRAIDDLKFRIPPRILEIVFLKRTQRFYATAKSIDEQILNQVVKPRVLVDCDVVGGVETQIQVGDLDYEVFDDYTFIYRIPKDRTQGRSILSPLSLMYTNPNRSTTYGLDLGFNTSTMMHAGQAVMDSHAAIPVTSTSRVELIGENVVMVKDSVVPPLNAYLHCIVSNDSELSNIKMRSWPSFCKLVELAVKSYIYNTYIVELDLGELVGGQQLGRVKDIIEGYADSEELYQTHLREKWMKTALMNDGASYTRLLNLMIGGYR